MHAMPQLFLEDLTFSLISFLSQIPSPLLNCKICTKHEECLLEGRKWVSSLLTKWPEEAAEADIGGIHFWKYAKNDLARFWKSIAAGTPEIKTYLLYKYFAARFNLKKEHNVTDLLKIFERREFLPQFYTKAIPFALETLVRDRMTVIEELYTCVYELYRKRARA
jgi:hypothetical protein